MSFDRAAGTARPLARHRVLELFAGVGGFRLGLEEANQRLTADPNCSPFEVVWANQWEPGSVKQVAAKVYEANWGDAPVNRDLFEVVADQQEMARVGRLAPTLLVAGFPCQDYSVAKPTSQSAGIQGKKGVLWWGIHELLKLRLDAGQPIETLLLENVDRLLSSPSRCRGRDFSIILASLQSLGYATAWQVVNAADYGFPQRRKRVFMVAAHRSSPGFQAWCDGAATPARWLTSQSPLAKALPIELESKVDRFELPADVHGAQETYQPERNGATRFAPVGFCVNGQVMTAAFRPKHVDDFTPYTGHRHPQTLGDIVAASGAAGKEFFLDEVGIEKWRVLKGAKAVDRVSAAGHAYRYTEGAVAFPDPLGRASRTIITSEGGSGPSRTRHVVALPDGRLRRLLPEELEALNGFPRGFTAIDGVTDVQRAFLMGNALVTGVVARIGMVLGADRVRQPRPETAVA